MTGALRLAVRGSVMRSVKPSVFTPSYEFCRTRYMEIMIGLLKIKRSWQLDHLDIFVEISNMTHDPPEGVVRFTNGTDEVAYKMPHMIEQYNSLSDLEKEHTKSVNLRNEEDKRRGVEYVMSKVLGFYKECLELGPEYVTRMDDEGEVTKAHLLEDKQIQSVGVFDEKSFTTTTSDVEPTKGLKTKESKSGSSKGTKSQLKSSGKSVYVEEPEFEVADSDMPHDQEENLGNDDEEPKRKDNPEGGDFDLTKPLLLVINENRQIVPVDCFFNNDLKYLQGGISNMTYTNCTTKTKAAQYDIQGIKDMVPNIWNPVKVAYDKYALWGISHWRQQRKTFYAYTRGLESSHDVYSTKRILAVTRVEVMRKHGYGYLREIEVRRADNDLYTFKEGDFLRLRINHIEDMLILIVQNMLTNLSGDDNIRMEYLPQRRWSSLEKKRAHIMIKAIDKQLKERRMMSSFEKFVGGRHYGTDLRLLQRTI
ncbi:hypothetical protein Tco_0140723 [Tanacetum coccineum]